MTGRLFARIIPGLLLLLALAAQATELDRGLLWKVEKGGQVNYLFGTIHSEDPRVLALPPAVTQALAQGRVFVMEVVPEPEAMQTIAMTMMYTDGRELPQVIGEPLYRKAKMLAAGYGIPDNALRLMKPWALATTLSLPKPKTGLFLDNKLYQRAQQGNKVIQGLETALEQLSVFDGMSLADQVTMLRETVDHYAQNQREIDELMRAYLDRDLSRMHAIYLDASSRSDAGFSKRFNERLVERRNRLMLERMRPLYEQGGTFVAVGALHLPGDTGLLKGLQRQGYHLTRLY